MIDADIDRRAAATCPTASQDLWADVLYQGLRDVAAGIDQAWLHSVDFEMVCMFAGVRPEVARAAAPLVKPICKPKAKMAA